MRLSLGQRGLGLAFSALLCLSCGKDDSSGAASGGGGSGGSGGTSGSGGSGGTAGAAGSAGAAPCTNDGGPNAVCVLSVKGRAVDALGSPVPGLSTSVCGSVCWYGESDATGAFTVTVGERIPVDQYSSLPHGRPDRTNFYFALPSAASEIIDVGDLTLLDLPKTGPGLVVRSDKQGAPAQSVKSGELTLSVSAGTQVKLDVEDVALDAAGKQFRALSVPAAQRALFAPASLNLVALFALTPFESAIVDETTALPALAQLSADNTPNLPAGTPVEWLALGSYLFDDWVKPAAFAVVATGSVSADGARIEMDAGQGVRYLTWVGVRAKP
ncbi:MAG: hypothetical protein IPI67_17270 [Myxococcales bacterium]|nr:hypothetical protein [Myxococcales bacterium]